ncbi:hypothetical protein [Raoultella ornithinolytica]|uniref:hypothetical protein n=1 Tax=Raoultella ornithinolytica TaxID=54291 RepID=UPI001BDB6B43|nr:hypothetical protein [Raoultella ornithinolytica]
MSKRFGRNQRRRAREELAAATADLNWHQSRASHLQNELWQVNLANTRMRNELAAAKEVIGRHHPSFPAEDLDLGFFPEPEYTLRIPVGIGDIAEAHAMIVTVNGNHARNECHFRLYYADQYAGYVISHAAMQSVDADFLCHRITGELVSHVITAYRKAKGGAA